MERGRERKKDGQEREGMKRNYWWKS